MNTQKIIAAPYPIEIYIYFEEEDILEFSMPCSTIEITQDGVTYRPDCDDGINHNSYVYHLPTTGRWLDNDYTPFKDREEVLSVLRQRTKNKLHRFKSVR
jgi:hypothetical protein